MLRLSRFAGQYDISLTMYNLQSLSSDTSVMTPPRMQKPANLGSDSSLSRLQRAASTENAALPTACSPQQAVRDDKHSLTQPALSGEGRKEEAEDNDSLSLNPVYTDLENGDKIRSRIEDRDLTPNKAEEVGNRTHEEVEGRSEEANDEGVGIEDVTSDNQAHEQLLWALCSPLRRGKRKWEMRSEMDDDARPQGERKARALTSIDPACTRLYRPSFRQLVGQRSYQATSKRVQTGEGGQGPLHILFRYGKWKWQMRRRIDGEAMIDREGQGRIQIPSPASQTQVHQPYPTHLLRKKMRLAAQKRLTIWQRLEAVEKGQQTFRKQLERDKREFGIGQQGPGRTGEGSKAGGPDVHSENIGVEQCQ